MGSGVWALAAWVIITGLATGQATAGAAALDGRSGNAGNAMAGPGGRRPARVRRVRFLAHGLVVDGQGAVGDGDTEGVAGEIVECRLRSLAP
jgi:hypothetical protein